MSVKYGLRRDGFLPVYVRIDYSLDAPSPREQVRTAMAEAGLEIAALANSTLSLWEYLHIAPPNPSVASPDHAILVLVFDQFEELFTLGGKCDAARGQEKAFLNELADLAENRPPRDLETKLAENPGLIDEITFDSQDYRIVLSLREDFLPDLDDMKSLMPSLMENRMRLNQLKGKQALKAVRDPVPGLVSEQVARQIVCIVAKAGSHGEDTSLPDDVLETLTIAPPILSLFCSKLNEQRLAQDPPQLQITQDLLEGRAEQILDQFYEGCFSGQPDALRTFVEEELVTESGFRFDMPWEQAVKHLAEQGVPETILSYLVDQRLLKVEERLNLKRVELTHDVLAAPAIKSRIARRQRALLADGERREQEALQREQEAQRKQREAERQKWWVVGISVAFLVVVSGMFLISYIQWQNAEENKKEAVRSKEEALRQKDMALQTINRLTYDLPDCLQSFPGTLSVLKDIFEENAEALNELDQSGGDSIDAEREQVSNYIRLSNTWALLGNLKESLEVLQKTLPIGEHLVEYDPENTDRLGLISLIHVNLGLTYREMGDLPSSIAAFQKSKKLYEHLMSLEPEHLDWQKNLSDSNAQLGEIFKMQRNFNEALPAIEKALEIAKGFTESDSNDVNSSLILTTILINRGDVYIEQGKFDSALKDFRTALDLIQIQLKIERDNQALKREEVRAHERIGDVWIAMENHDGDALAEYKKALDIAKRIAEKDPENTDWQNILTVYLVRVGETLFFQDKFKDALTHFKKANVVIEPLAQRDPANATWEINLITIYDRIGETLAALGDLRDAKKNITKAHQLAGKSLDMILQTGDQGLRRKHYLYTSLAWESLLLGNAREAVTAAEQVLRLEEVKKPSDICNLAHAYLFSDRFDEAKANYLVRNKSPVIAGQSFRNAVLSDYKKLRFMGVTHPDMARIEQLFEITSK